MIDLSTTYLGLPLKNPLVPSSSPLCKQLDTVLQLEDAGAAAIVLHSFYEEELIAEDAMADRFLLHAELHDGESAGFLPDHGSYESAIDRYLEHLRRVKARVGIPVIASLNGVTPSGWVDLGREMEAAGADALELNVYHIAADPIETGDAVEARYLALLTELKRTVAVPVVMKLPPFFASLPNFVRRLEAGGAAGVSLFNRFFQPDIDLDSLEMVDRLELSSPDEALLRIRWIAILRAQTRITLAATGGVYGYQEALKLLLAGADVVHLASCLLEHGPARLTQILHDLRAWMADREYESVAQLKGSMCQANLRDASSLARQSYIRVLDSFTPRPGVWR
ncbi:MAG: dihydroorotate dehydrogenase-like protein [Zoogloea sp.]|nr:dihydroorotate dehydrogenase-like protein [Zoogloea sp.]